MSIWDRFLKQLCAPLRRRNKTQEFARELQADLELETEEQQHSGVSAEEAGYAARRAFGNTSLISEDVRSVWTMQWLEGFLRDLRYAGRALRKNPGFAVVAISTLALGIGANSAIFSTINALMLRPLPFTEADQLVRIFSTKDGALLTPNGAGRNGGPSAMDMRDFARNSHTFQQMVAYDTWRKNVSFGEGAGEPEQMQVGLVPAAYFEILDVKPFIGRLFVDGENQPGKNYVAIIGMELWERRCGRDPAILNRKIRINDELYTIVGVLPDVFPEWMEARGRESGAIQVWTPLAMSDLWTEEARGARGFSTVGRMNAGVSLEQAQADLATIGAALAAEHAVDRGIGVSVKRLADTRAGNLRPMLFLLMGSVSLILLIACVNLANLLLARNSARQRELALRTALGAGRPGLVRHLLAETLLLSLIGAAAGLLLAHFGLAALTRSHPKNLPQLDSLSLDWRVLLFTFAVSIVTSILFGLAPALAGTRIELVEALKQGGRSGSSGPGSQRMRRMLVVVEMAMSLVLLVGAGLLTQSIMRLEGQNLGIRADHLLKGHFYLPGVRYGDPAAITRFCDEFARRVRTLPGVVEATVTTAFPPNNGWFQMLWIPERPATRREDVPSAQFGVADAHFLTTMGIPLVRGRDFRESDDANSPPVALVNEEFVRRYFSTEEPVGRRIHIGPPAFLKITPGTDISDSSDVMIIGVTGNFRNAGLVAPPDPHITVLYAQHPLVNYGFKDIVIRTVSEPRQLAPEIRRQLQQLDADMPFAEVQTIQEVIEQQTGGQRFTTVLLSLFAVSGLVLAMVGIYGVISFLVAQRKQELAVRIAVGASRGNVLWLVLKQGLTMAAIGAALGLLGAAAAEKVTRGLLFGISPLDPVTFAGAAMFLLAVAAAASAIPGARVLRLDPARTLRQD